MSCRRAVLFGRRRVVWGPGDDRLEALGSRAIRSRSLHRVVAAGHVRTKRKAIPVSSQGSSNPETRINADVLGARSQALGDLLRRTAARKPDKLALVNGELRWSYRELDQAVNRMAASLSRRGLSHGDRLAPRPRFWWQTTTRCG